MGKRHRKRGKTQILRVQSRRLLSAVPTAVLDSPAGLGPAGRFIFSKPMGKQYNKVIKKKRREAYAKRKKVAAAATAKKIKAKK